MATRYGYPDFRSFYLKCNSLVLEMRQLVNTQSNFETSGTCHGKMTMAMSKLITVTTDCGFLHLAVGPFTIRSIAWSFFHVLDFSSISWRHSLQPMRVSHPPFRNFLDHTSFKLVCHYYCKFCSFLQHRVLGPSRTCQERKTSSLWQDAGQIQQTVWHVERYGNVESPW